VLASGLTGYLNDRVLVPNPDLNTGLSFSAIKIPGLGDIPIIGPIFFDSTIFLYIMYLLIILVQVGLFRTRWGLRVRAVGEHPTAAATVGIRVLATRYRNVIMGGLIAGIGGAYLTVGSVGTFSKDMSSGLGYIALAAMIFGRWTPLGATAAALLFGFANSLQSTLSTINVPIPSYILLMAPYAATIIAVAGLVGRVRAPAADGQPYIRS
jgi:simple sugar transport system permease protein